MAGRKFLLNERTLIDYVSRTEQRGKSHE
jgi:hypothetical protein